jgi:hypothetical protein
MVRAVLRWWAAYPWRCLVLAVVGAVLLSGSGMAVACLAVAWLSLVQGLRALWRRSRVAAALLAVLLLAAGWSIPPPGAVAADVTAAVALALAPLLAWAADIVIGRRRRAQGALWLDLPTAVPSRAIDGAGGSAGGRPSSAFKRHRSGCLVLLALAVAFGLYFGGELTAPHRHASATVAALRPGADVSEILAAARGGFLCSLTDAEGRPVLRVHTWGGSRFDLLAGDGASLGASLSREELLRRLGQRAGDLAAARRMGFTFTTGAVPLRVSFTVTLDEHGRLLSVSALRAWD